MKPTEAAIRQAVQQHGPAVVHRCRAFTRDSHAAEDLAQEVFARVLEVVANPGRDREDIPWKLLESVMRIVFLEYLRCKKKTPVPHAEVEHMVEPDPPNDEVSEQEQKAVLRSLVERLSTAEQQAVLGRHFLEMNAADLSRFLEVPRTSLVNVYNRGMTRLREMARDHGLLP